MGEDYTIQRFRGELALVFYDKDGARKRFKIGTSNQSEAEKLAPALYAELTRPTSKRIDDLWEAYRRDKVGRAILRAMKHTWKPLKERFAAMSGEDVTIADCRAHRYERRSKGVKDGTIHTELGHLRMVLRWAEKHQLIGKAPFIELPPKPKPKHDYLTKAQAADLIQAAEGHVRLYVILALTTGGRNSALLDLTWDRVDFASGMLDLRNPEITTPHKGRAIVPINSTLKKALDDAKKIARSDYVVEYAGGKVKSVKTGLTNAAKRAGLGPVSPHMLRHSAAVHMAEARVSMDEIAQFLGHSNVQTTRDVYARFSPEYLRGPAAALEYEGV